MHSGGAILTHITLRTFYKMVTAVNTIQAHETFLVFGDVIVAQCTLCTIVVTLNFHPISIYCCVGYKGRGCLAHEP